AANLLDQEAVVSLRAPAVWREVTSAMMARAGSFSPRNVALALTSLPMKPKIWRRMAKFSDQLVNWAKLQPRLLDEKPSASMQKARKSALRISGTAMLS